jgi:hypothetical protein
MDCLPAVAVRLNGAMDDPLVSAARSLAEFRAAFPDETSCAEYLFNRRWPNGFVCPCCGSTGYASLKSRAYTFECLGCGHQTSITAGTAMHRSQLSLEKWFFAAHLIASQRGRVSARRLQDELKIAYQTALEVKRKLQLTKIPEQDEPLQGVVEVDLAGIPFEAYS